eukprot:547779_1
MASEQSHMPIRQSKIHSSIKITNHLLTTYSDDDVMKYSTNPYVEPEDATSILTLYQTTSLNNNKKSRCITIKRHTKNKNISSSNRLSDNTYNEIPNDEAISPNIISANTYFIISNTSMIYATRFINIDNGFRGVVEGVAGEYLNLPNDPRILLNAPVADIESDANTGVTVTFPICVLKIEFFLRLRVLIHCYLVGNKQQLMQQKLLIIVAYDWDKNIVDLQIICYWSSFIFCW